MLQQHGSINIPRNGLLNRSIVTNVSKCFFKSPQHRILQNLRCLPYISFNTTHETKKQWDQDIQKIHCQEQASKMYLLVFVFKHTIDIFWGHSTKMRQNKVLQGIYFLRQIITANAEIGLFYIKGRRVFILKLLQSDMKEEILITML